jgi:hypothetical protein
MLCERVLARRRELWLRGHGPKRPTHCTRAACTPRHTPGAARAALTCKHGHDLGAARLEASHHAAVVALVAGDQVAALQHQPDDGRVRRQAQVAARVVPGVAQGCVWGSGDARRRVRDKHTCRLLGAGNRAGRQESLYMCLAPPQPASHTHTHTRARAHAPASRTS